MKITNNGEKSSKQLDNELREDVKLRMAEGFVVTDEEMLIDNGSSLILRIGGKGGKDIEIKFIVKKEQFDIEIQEEVAEVEVVAEVAEEVIEEE